MARIVLSVVVHLIGHKIIVCYVIFVVYNITPRRYSRLVYFQNNIIIFYLFCIVILHIRYTIYLRGFLVLLSIIYIFKYIVIFAV